MRLIDAEPIEKKLLSMADRVLGKDPYEKARICAYRRAFEMVLHAPSIAPPIDEPLTLKELRKMSWEPAWVEGDREPEIGRNGWAIIWHSEVERYVCIWWPATEYADIPSLDYYGDTWKAYHCRPKETAK